MKRTAKWHKKLTIAELKHLCDDVGSCTLRAVEDQIKWQKDNGGGSVCWECWGIGRKLGMVGD
jgi:hypothetical protein